MMVGTTETYTAAAARRELLEELKKHGGKMVVVEGVIEPPETGADPSIAITSVELLQESR